MINDLCTLAASGLELKAPAVPQNAARFMPGDPENLGTALLEMLWDGILAVSPHLKEAAYVCLAIFCVVLIMSIVYSVPGCSLRSINLVSTLIICTLLFESFQSFIHLAGETISELSEYGKLLIPIMTTSLAAQGCVTASAALYTGTAIFDSILSSFIAKLLIPMINLYLALAAAKSAVGEDLLKKISDQMKSLMTWILKTLLYVYTGYITITSVMSGTTDAAALKAAKLTIAGAVPVVGGILSDASEAVLVSAGTVKNSVGLYGMIAIIAIWIGPFIRIGVQYLLLKITGALCGSFGSKEIAGLLADLSTAMGMLVAMTGAVCLMLLISLVCFIKGAA